MTRQWRRPDSGRRRHRPCARCIAATPTRLAAVRACMALLLLAPLTPRLCAAPIPARGYLIDVWQGERGFPQNTVTGIAQTPDGYLWLTTLDGVARFDGLRFKMFKAADTAALGSGRIRFLFTGRHGDLWLSTQEGAVVHVLNGRFEPLPLPNPLGVRVAVVVSWVSRSAAAVRRWRRRPARHSALVYSPKALPLG